MRRHVQKSCRQVAIAPSEVLVARSGDNSRRLTTICKPDSTDILVRTRAASYTSANHPPMQRRSLHAAQSQKPGDGDAEPAPGPLTNTQATNKQKQIKTKTEHSTTKQQTTMQGNAMQTIGKQTQITQQFKNTYMHASVHTHTDTHA